MQRRRSPSTFTRLNPRSSALGGERRFRPCLPGTQSSKLSPKIIQRLGGLVAAVLAHRECIVGLLVAVHDDVRDLLDLGVPDPLADRLVAVVDLDAVGPKLL